MRLFLAPLESLEESNVGIGSDVTWIDVTTPLLEHFQQNRFSGYERIGRAQLNPLRLYMGNDQQLIPWEKACHNGDSNACDIARWIRDSDKKLGLDCLKRVGSSICNQLYDNKIKGFLLGYEIDDSIPWSQRYTAQVPKRQFHVIGAFPRDFSVAKSIFLK